MSQFHGDGDGDGDGNGDGNDDGDGDGDDNNNNDHISRDIQVLKKRVGSHSQTKQKNNKPLKHSKSKNQHVTALFTCHCQICSCSGCRANTERRAQQFRAANLFICDELLE